MVHVVLVCLTLMRAGNPHPLNSLMCRQELATKDFASRVDVYPGVGHGFTLRPELKGDVSDEVRCTKIIK